MLVLIINLYLLWFLEAESETMPETSSARPVYVEVSKDSSTRDPEISEKEGLAYTLKVCGEKGDFEDKPEQPETEMSPEQANDTDDAEAVETDGDGASQERRPAQVADETWCAFQGA